LVFFEELGTVRECRNVLRHPSGQRRPARELTIDDITVLCAVESGQPEIAETRREGLVRNYGFATVSSGTGYFDFPATLDVEHAAAEKAPIEPRLDDADAVELIAEAEAVLNASWEFLDSVERLTGRLVAA
jgi:pyrroloquinoline quinone (PQQ) biosynthesis protein C